MNYYNTSDVAKLLGVTKRTLANYRVKNIGPPCIKVGGRWLYDKLELKKYMKSL